MNDRASAVQVSQPPIAHASTARIAALADLHCRTSSVGAFQTLFGQVSQRADVLILPGDLTDRGLPEEAHVLARELISALSVPVVAVLGNHDYEAGHEREVTQILADAGVVVLDGDACEVRGVGFAGVKGFPGGFGAQMLQSWGESTIKQFVRETVDETLKLESALAKLHTPHRIVLTHYAPIRATVIGESPEIFPFLGSSRLEEPLARFGVTAAFHGHAHAGSLEGRAAGDVPVYNVALPLLAIRLPGQPPFRIVEVGIAPPQDGGADPALPQTQYHVQKDIDP